MEAVRNAFRWAGRNRWAVVAALLVINIFAIGALVLALAATERPEVETAEQYAELSEARAAREDVHAEPSVPSVLPPTATAAAPTEDANAPNVYTAPATRIRIASIGVDAPLTSKGIRPDGVMDSPDGPDDVALYDFTAKPGLGSNAVLSGHVDYINHGPAVFWDLEDLVQGETMEIVLEDGTLLRYAVTAIQSYPVAEVPMVDVIAPSTVDTLTLITCDGASSGGSYSHRLIVRATIVEAVPPGSGDGT